MATPYDEIAYPTTAFRQTHPNRLGTHAALFGLPFAPAAACRVLDIGCGDGANIIPMAVAHPGSQFVGFDLSERAIARGQGVIEALKLPNVRLEALDIAAADFGAGGFDYVIAHGLYSWIPQAVRDAMMAGIRHHLAVGGVAFVSHNALPGGHAHRMIREMLLFHLRGVEGPTARVQAAILHLRRMPERFGADTPFARLAKSLCLELLERPPPVLAHDELGEVFEPVHLHEFLEHAGRHGLQFLTEAGPTRCGEGFRPPYALDDADFDVLAHAQELDFDVLRNYRQNLLVHADVALDRRPEPSRLLGLRAATPAQKADEPGVYDVGTLRFQLDDAALQGVVERLSLAWPAALPINELVDDEARLGALLRMYWSGAIELHSAAEPFSIEVGERPCASPLARLQASRGEQRVTTLRHAVVEIGDATGLSFIASLDGRRTVDQIAVDIASELGGSPEQIKPQLVAKLNELARLGLLF
ncbi:MAG TPA: methyltransferase domain-containing protein [Caulobacteraceae bacterium]|nr:methyltransferase domain-containing protein [Caulobacteraceae bacterium]